MSANDRQVGGSHYKSSIQHWDYTYANSFDTFQYIITKYLHRWKNKNGIQDLYKARHALDKYIEVVESEKGITSEDKVDALENTISEDEKQFQAEISLARGRDGV